MSERRTLRSFDYVNRPYAPVRAALTADPEGLFREATRAAATRIHSLAAELRVDLAGVKVGAEIDISVGQIEEVEKGPAGGPATNLPLNWAAARHPRLFPLMRGVLSVYALTASETQLDFEGRYEPPLGPLGSALDAAVLHRLAEASVHRFVQDVARYLREGMEEG